MALRLSGVENEYRFAAYDRHRKRIDQGVAVERFFRVARKSVCHLPDIESSGMYLANGARFYPDCGKPEMASPEVASPWELCRFVKAGERILADVAMAMARERGVSEVVLSRHNVGYGAVPTTWASHASFGHRADPGVLPQQLIPHFVSRVIYTGAGGFNSRSAGIEFMLSPRVAFLQTDVSHGSTENRGIFHCKHEPLCSGFHRLHVLTGESLCSETSLWLTNATTALIVALIESGGRPGDTVLLRQPLGAMRTFVTDPLCSARVKGLTGRSLTALEIQQHYLDAVKSRCGSSALPDWATEACVKWQEMLNRLKLGTAAVSSTLDWAIKLRLFQHHAQKRGIDWESLPLWNRALDELRSALSAAMPGRPPAVLTADLLSRNGPVAAVVRRLTPQLARHGLSWEQLPTLLDVQQELFELDSRFGELSDRGLFDALDRADVLEHRVDGVGPIADAMTAPPAIGRARIRGQCVRRYQNQSGYACSWSGVYDLTNDRYMDLSNPFELEEKWVARSFESSVRYRLMGRQVRNRQDEATVADGSGEVENWPSSF
jgi:hypothetical protein